MAIAANTAASCCETHKPSLLQRKLSIEYCLGIGYGVLGISMAILSSGIDTQMVS